MLSLVGLGIGDGKSIAVEGLDLIKNAKHIFIENYTAEISANKLEWLQNEANSEITVLSREEVEEPNLLLDKAKDSDVVLLVEGDPLSATTHNSLKNQCKSNQIEFNVVHGSSILTIAAGLVGLQHYKFGPTATLVMREGNYEPKSPLEKIKANIEHGYHTLVLLDIKKDNPEEKGKTMSATEGLQQISQEIDNENLACVIERAGYNDSKVIVGKISELIDQKFGETPHSIIIPGDLHFAEKETIEQL